MRVSDYAEKVEKYLTDNPDLLSLLDQHKYVEFIQKTDKDFVEDKISFEVLTTIHHSLLDNVTDLFKELTIVPAQFLYDDRDLTELNIPEGVTSIGYVSFYDCQKLEKVSLPKSLTEIGPSAFGNCISLTSIIIPEAVDTISTGAFNHCSSLREITFLSNPALMYRDVFRYCCSLNTINIANNAKDVLDKLKQDTDLKNNIEQGKIKINYLP